MNSLELDTLLLIDEDSASRTLIRFIVRACRDDNPAITEADSFAGGVSLLRASAAAAILLGQASGPRTALLQLKELRSLAGGKPIIPYRPYLTLSVIAEARRIGPEAVARQDQIEGLRQLIRATRDPRVLTQPALAAVAAPPPSLRQARLKPEWAERYPGLQPGCWLPASVVAQYLLGRVLDMPNPAPALLQRLMNDLHFEFQGGERRPTTPDPGTRLADV